MNAVKLVTNNTVSILFIILLILLLFKPKRVNKQTKVALCACTRKPSEFGTWLDHHFKIGMYKIFLRVEETPELKSIIQSHPRNEDIIAMYIDHVDKTDNWHSLQDRQSAFTKHVIKTCRSKYPEITWLFQNIDDDELLSPACGNIETCLQKVPQHKQAVYVSTVEAVFPKVNTDANVCFNSDKFVDCDNRKLCTSYYGGKSAGRITPDLRPHGPHQFAGNNWKGKSSNKCYSIDKGVLKVLHYESCNFEKWKHKYSAMNNKHKSIPKGFKFYNESVNAVDRSESQALEYYKSKKVDPYYNY